MNERIKVIADEVFAHFTNTNTWSTSNEFCEKFAELIVRECAEVSNQAEKQCQHPGTMIRKHFGVE